MTIDISRMFSGQFGFPPPPHNFGEPKLNSTFPEAKVQLLLLNSSFLQRIGRGFQYSNSQNDFVEIIGSKKKHVKRNILQLCWSNLDDDTFYNFRCWQRINIISIWYVLILTHFNYECPTTNPREKFRSKVD